MAFNDAVSPFSARTMKIYRVFKTTRVRFQLIFSVVASGNCDFTVAIFKGQHSPSLLVTAFEMPSFKTKCTTCLREFATQRSLAKHAEKTGHHYQETDVQFFKPGETEPVNLPLPERVPPSQQEAFKEFLSGVAELINSYLKPDVKSKWVKIDLIMVPNAFFKSLLLSMGLTKPFSAREARHPPPLKMELSTALYYNVYDISVLTNVFAAILPLKTKAYFRCNQEVQAPQSGSNLTAQEKIALARQRAGARWGSTSDGSTVDFSEKPTSRRQLKCEEGEWPRTREFQVIWWPNVFAHSNFGHLRLRFYLEHVELAN